MELSHRIAAGNEERPGCLETAGSGFALAMWGLFPCLKTRLIHRAENAEGMTIRIVPASR
ncbi:Glycerol-3-phosphate ABC transporter, periplasmic glycerol-3-phosphate-binding protein [Brucella suis bv. 2]|nr:Glycerol-3-phosphate ABC transporter, periplasmic glycerol-3-phosphate-binding protein [Brucella suis bv. 2]AIB22704.1 Glycerol-3-phosphate ABC transporter, periplasmic glycerol-3-phosphate-binding protein [Brucella suis bv. 2]AIB26062.1 Glycerol-3-phosphate ABC transporter, periplasmic glycerol-3-phosphate-binding protein [Brucella suis bv. 2]AIB29454.1 Glycerol-3-phosphate ABC transporter, periplasmic glycerol-3-phosphate-binding protein [Brucella suis bv. 2]AIB32831.1 Glycerol-3-phosphate